MTDFCLKIFLLHKNHYKMRYSLKSNHRKCVQGYGFLSFERTFGDKFSKKLVDTATKTGRDASKTASKRVVQKHAEATGDLIGNKIADKITSAGKSKNKQKKDKMNEMNETEAIYIPPEKNQQIINDLRLF